MRRLIGMALVATMMALGFAARAEESIVDPAKVSDSLKAIFQFGSAQTKQALNQNTVTLITGTIRSEEHTSELSHALTSRMPSSA